METAMEGLRRSLTEKGPIKLSTYIIKTPSSTWKIYGSPYIVYRRLNLDIDFKQYLSSPYITITIDSDNIRSFLWFWYYINGLWSEKEEDLYWKSLSFYERLYIWPYLKAIQPPNNILKWYLDNIFLDFPFAPAMEQPRLDEDKDLTTFNVQPRMDLPWVNDIYHTLVGLLVDWRWEISPFVRALSRFTGMSVGRHLALKRSLPSSRENVQSVILDDTRYFEFEKPETLGDDIRIYAYNSLLTGDESGYSVYDYGTETLREYKNITMYNNTFMPLKSLGVPVFAQSPKRNVYFLYEPMLFPIRVGDITLHGDLLTMRSRSELIDSTLSEGDREFSLLSNEKVDLDPFLYVWGYLNGIEEKSLNLLTPWYYINYFHIPLDTFFVEDYITTLITNITTIERYRDVLGIMKKIPSGILDKYRIMEVSKSGTPLADERMMAKHLDIPVTFRKEYRDYNHVSPYGVRTGDVLICWSHLLFTIDVREIKVDADGIIRDHVRDGYIIHERNGRLIESSKFNGAVTTTLIACIRSPKPLRSKYPKVPVIARGIKVKKAVFNIAPDIKEELVFSEPIEGSEAFKRITDYLSEPTTEEYYRIVRPRGIPWVIAKEAYPIRGDLLNADDTIEAVIKEGGILEVIATPK